MPAPSGYVLPVTLERHGNPVEVGRVPGPEYTFSFVVTPGSYRLFAPGDAAVSVVIKGVQRTDSHASPGCAVRWVEVPFLNELLITTTIRHSHRRRCADAAFSPRG